MKSLASGIVLIAIARSTLACGPWFPDSVLDDPQSALVVPPVCYEAEIATLFPDRAFDPAPAIRPEDGDMDSGLLLKQIPRERAELEEWWKGQGLDANEIERRSKAYEELRVRQLSAIGSVGFQELVIADPAAAKAIPERPLADLLPPDVADFVEASRLVILGRVAEARRIWQSILDRPAAEKTFRGAWAAWMLAKTSEDWESARDLYARVREEVAAGAKDCIALAPDAAAWLGPREEDRIKGLKLLVQSWREGRKEALIDLRRLTSSLLEQASPEELAACAADPLARQILTIEVFTQLDGNGWREQEAGATQPFPYANWLTALEEHANGQVERADRVAWALYSLGHYATARTWLARAEPGTPRAFWLKAKFALMDGKPEQADRSLERAVTVAKRSLSWSAANPIIDETHWLDTNDRLSSANGRLLADAAVVDLSRGQYSSALARLTEAGYWSDAAYIAERLLSTDELIAHVKRHAPKWSEELSAYWSGKQEDMAKPAQLAAQAKNQPDMWTLTEKFSSNDQLRYLLGRRLTREFRFREGRTFMPEPMLPLYDHFVALHRAGISNKYNTTEKTAILWNKAAILREFGLIFIGTEGAPDGFERWGAFESTDFFVLRSRREGWKAWWDYEEENDIPPSLKEKLKPHQVANPRVTLDEIRRARAHGVVPNLRFHYRYRAADIAWKAAELAPDNSNTKVHILNTAGKWLATRDPVAADRFYKALVRRNWSHPLGEAADKKRWFISMDVPPDLPQLPAGLRPE